MDSRERKPLPIPKNLAILNSSAQRVINARIHVLTGEKLATGDYALEGYLSHRLIERKAGVRELEDCVAGKSHAMFIRQLDRLRAECAAPLLFIEGHPIEFEARLLDGLFRLTEPRIIPVMFIGTRGIRQRVSAGKLVARLLISAALGVPVHASQEIQEGDPDGGMHSPPMSPQRAT